MILVVGLGNPGSRYASTRHNVGFYCVDLLAARHGLLFDRRQFDARLALGTLAGIGICLCKPQTFMNASGRAVRGAMTWFKIRPDHLVVVYDDLDLPVGRVRVRPRGSAGGHRGMQSIIESIGSEDFCRVRVGIGRPVGEDPITYVLRPFSRHEEPVVRLACETAADAIECLVSFGVSETMNKFNRDVNGP